jgi:hypothetical protein
MQIDHPAADSGVSPGAKMIAAHSTAAGDVLFDGFSN